MPAFQAHLATAVRLASGADRGWLEMRGRDTRDFLQRILTSDVRKLRAGGGQWSALLDGKGHWIAELMLFAWEDADGEVLGFDTPRACLDLLEASLDKFHFGEQVAWKRRTDSRLLVLGAGAAGALQAAGLPVPAPPQDGEAATRGFAATPDQAAGLRLLLQRPDHGQPCLELLGDAAAVAALAGELRAAGFGEAPAEELERWRIQAGIARHGVDFGAEDTLPESNEWRRASLSKGCYAGQEVVAKINTYGQAPWQLVRLRFDGATDMSGARLLAEDGTNAGTVTSWALAADGGHGVGLGKVRRKFALDGARLACDRVGAQDHARLMPQVREFG
ncbi:MAG TPA: hypothetical protein VGC54_03185 [Planctomycetota bacterium]